MVASRQASALAVTCLFSCLAALFVGARTLSRYMGRNFGWDDWLILVALVLLFGQTFTIYEYILVSHTGYHVYDIPKQTIAQQVVTAKWSFAVQMFYHPLMGTVRASIIMFLFRVKDSRWHIRVALHVVFWINIGYMASTTIVNIFQCDPIRYAYMRPQMDQDGLQHGKCINSLAFIMASCGISIFMDLIIIPIPTAMVWNLHMRKKTKIAVVAVMSMGWIATIASIVRLRVYHHRITNTVDKTWNIGLITSIAEPSVGIIAACAPAMKRLFSRLIPQYFSDDRYYATYPTRTPTKDNKSRPSRRRSFTTNYGMHQKEIGAEEGTDYIVEEEDGYGMRPLDSVNSRERSQTMIVPQYPQRTRSTKTGTSEGRSEAWEHEPAHVLNHAV